MKHGEDYASCYCEENVYRLCVHRADLADRVVFVSGSGGAAPVWRQEAGDPAVWDYHVFLLITRDHTVLDLDSTLPYPCDALQYCIQAFRPDIALEETYEHRFRVIPSSDFIRGFCSDRSHMLKSVAPSPAWPLIQSDPICAMNLSEYTNMSMINTDPAGNK
jgi:hypothetical protein